MTRLMLLLVFFVLTGINGDCYGQEIHWKETSKWRLYNLRNKRAFDMPIDSLKKLTSLPLSQDSMNMFTQQITVWPRLKTSVWMGLYVATFETSTGETNKLVISNYGGFLYDPVTKQYYEVPRQLRDAWYEWLNNKSRALIASSPQ